MIYISKLIVHCTILSCAITIIYAESIMEDQTPLATNLLQRLKSQPLTADVFLSQTAITSDIQDYHNVNVFKRDLKDTYANDAFDENFDDLELAEINVFRPVFRYRLAYSKQVKNTQRQQYGG